MPRYQAPDEESRIAVHAETGVRLYAELAAVPLYLKVRLLPGTPGQFGQRKSLHLGYLIDEQRIARNWAAALVPEELAPWIVQELREVYPSVAEAAGLSAEEIADLRREQARKRAEMTAKRKN